MGLLDLFRSRRLEDVLEKPVTVKVHGIYFKLRKINPIDYATGAQALQMHFQTYKTKAEKEQLAMVAVNKDKIREHYTDVICASVVEPKLSRKPEEEGAIHVDKLFTDWELASDLYLKIMEVTYGKKKFQSLMSQRKNFSTSTP